MREHINLNEVENPLFYLNNHSFDKYIISGGIECFVFDTMFNSIYKVNIKYGDSVLIKEVIYCQFRREVNGFLCCFGNGFIYTKNKCDAFDLLKSAWKRKIKECQDTEAMYNNLLKQYK